MDTKPDTIKILASQREEIEATHADLIVSVKGSSLVSGSTALKKAREVSQLVDELAVVGLPSEAIHLQSVYAENTAGPLLRSSSATYRLRIRCEKLEQLADVLGVITSQKNASLEQVTWKYPDQAARERLLEQAISKAQAKALQVAASFRVKLLGIHTFNENVSDEEAPFPRATFGAQAKSTRSVGVVPQADLGMEIQHSKTVEVFVEVEYRVSPFGHSE